MSRSASTGPTHLKPLEELEKIGVVPTGFLAFRFDAQALGLVLTDEVEGEVTQHRDVFGGRPRADAALILAEGHVEGPMDLIFDAPMAADHRAKILGRQGPTEQ